MSDLETLQRRVDDLYDLLWPQIRAAKIARLPPTNEWGGAKAFRDGHPLSSNPARPGSIGWEMWSEAWEAERAKAALTTAPTQDRG